MGQLIRRFRVLAVGMLALAISVLVAQAIDLGSGMNASDALAQTNPPPQTLAPSLPMVSGSFEDPQGQFKIGILDGYSVSTAAGSPLFQATDGSLAYTVVVVPLPPADDPSTAMVQAAEATFGDGEGFVRGDVQPIPVGGLRINWTGQLSQGTAPPQPITGKIFARQRGDNVFLLMVAATDAAESQLSDAIIALGSTLTVP